MSPAAEQPQSAEPAYVSVVAGPLAAPVLRRVVGMLAARAQLPVDRLDEAVMLVDALADRAGGLSADGRIAIAMTPAKGSLTLKLGPLRKGCAEQLIASGALPGLGNMIERLSDELDVEAVEHGELLRVRLRAPE